VRLPLLDRLNRRLAPVWYCLNNPGRIGFKYVGGPIRPDRVVCYDGVGEVYSFDWIRGHDAAPSSQLGRLYAMYEDITRRKDGTYQGP